MERFTKELQKTSGLSKTERKLLPTVDRRGNLYAGVDVEACNWIKSLLLAKDARKPSEVYRQHLSCLVDACVRPELQEEFYYALDEMNQFQASAGMYRRSVRGESYTPFVEAGVRLLWAYARLRFYGEGGREVSLADILTGNAAPDILKDARDENFSYAGMLAAQIDRGKEETIRAVKEVLLGDNNTQMISHELIRGIVMSRNEDLYQVLGDFLLAARLQEGARQAVCETMDAGRTEAFQYLFQIILDHGLIRYSSVKRAVSTWIGIYDYKSMERMADKLLKLMGECLKDPAFVKEQLAGEDAVGICCALWATAFYDVQKASDAVLRLAEDGTRHQMMTASYYLEAFQNRTLSMRAAKKVMFAYPEDLELIACYLPYFMGDVYGQLNEIMDYRSSGCSRYYYSPSYDKGQMPRMITTERLSLSPEEAKRAYGILKGIMETLPKKGLVLDPCIFPWYKVTMSRSDAAIRMCLLAWALQEDAYLDEAAGLLPAITDGRHLAARILLWRPKDGIRKQILLDCLHSQEENTRNVAFTLVKGVRLLPEDYRKIEGNMRYKKGRAQTLDILKSQEPAALRGSIERLLKEKSEESHMGGLELAQHLKKKNLQEYRLTVPILEAYENPTQKEQILLTELIGERNTAQDLLKKPGYGLYDPGKEWIIPEVSVDTEQASKLFVCGEQACIRVLERLDAWIGAHKDLEYEDCQGDEKLLGVMLAPGNVRGGGWNGYPFGELWEQFYEKEVGDPQLLMEVYLYLVCCHGRGDYGKHTSVYKKVFGTGVLKEPPFKNLVSRGSYPAQTGTVVNLMFQRYVPKEMKVHWGLVGIAKLFSVLETSVGAYVDRAKPWRTEGQHLMKYGQLPIFDNLLVWLKLADGEKFAPSFALRFRLRQHRGFDRLDAQGYRSGNDVIRFSDFVQCCLRGIWDQEQFYKAVFTYYDMGRLLAVITSAAKSCLDPLSGGRMGMREMYDLFGDSFGTSRRVDGSEPEVQFALALYDEVVPKVLEVELRRGEQATPFSRYVSNICMVRGIPVLIRLLHAIGNDVLDQNAYYYGNGEDRRRVLSCLLMRCYPGKEETAEDLRQALAGTGIAKKRLVELAMYAPQWIPLLEPCLGLSGLQSGCCYFMAHTSEWLDDGTMAMVAKYTPLTREELCGGAFDVRWFKESYEQLGEKDFQLLYQAAKYSSGGTAHARAKKYADAALGKTDFETLKTQIDGKRNKDLLMSLPLLPLSETAERREEELLERYQYIQNYRKESRQFGAQRRASEGRAADMALQNLSTNAGFSDVTRLMLRMETRLTASYDGYFAWQPAEDVQIRVFVDEAGKSSLQCQRDGKTVKSLPAKYKKNETVAECQAIVKKLKEQHARTRKMLEQAMEDGTVFAVWELWALLQNPVVSPLIKTLVYVTAKDCETAGRMGFLSEEGLTDWSGRTVSVRSDTRVRVAHPCDFYQEGHWQEYQRALFEQKTRQPFKQVFRELYVKLPEELEKRESRLFSGYQIQPQKTAATLRGRRWVADYESGLQKVYYKEDIIAVLLALADWFSPGDIEAPTLESVVFYDRRNFTQKKISEIPERIYSEVMRDVDLAVSTAFVGGVDPEASHSTVEMRRVIVEENLRLFRIKNVRLQGTHAVIDGTLGQYTVHLGSGVIHQVGNAMLHVLPVHSQHRGKIFLPFLDEDPKTAEILTKILMFADDAKIKDPSVIRQICEMR